MGGGEEEEEAPGCMEPADNRTGVLVREGQDRLEALPTRALHTRIARLWKFARPSSLSSLALANAAAADRLR